MDKVTKFNLEAAFKALDELDIPTVKGIRANRVNLSEHFTHKAATTALIEDYYDVGSTDDLNDAQEAREAEVAKAKLARIEKIVDLNAETEEDLLPSYVGKNIIQCPQCMTLFYKNPEDIEASEENPEVVNINEVCQHCGNTSGYELIGKVDKVGEDEAANFDVEDFEGDELNLDFDEPTEEIEEEESAEEAPAEEEDLELDLDLDFEEEPAEEEVQESLSLKEDWDTDVATADELLDEIVKQSGNENYDDGDGYWASNNKWCNRYMYYANSIANREKVEELCKKHSTDVCTFYVIEDDAEDDPVSEIGYNLVKKANESLTEGTISISKAEMAKLDKEVADATTEVAKYKIPMKSQMTSAGTTDSVPDFEAVPESEREAAKKAYDRYKKALAARPNRAKNIINYTDESVHKSKFLKKAEKDELKSDNDSEYLTLNEETTEESVNNSEFLKKAEKDELKSDNDSEYLTLNEKVVVNKRVDDLCAVMNGDQQIFVGTEEECKDWLEARKSPATTVPGKFKIVKGAEVPVVEENITEAVDLTEDSGFDELMDMLENEPISEAEVEAMLDGPLFTDKEEEVDFEVVEDFDEESFNEHLSRYFTEVYSNVKAFEVTSCELKENRLVVEGLIKFNSGKERKTAFSFEKSSKKTLSGLNEDFAAAPAFELSVKVASKKIITEGLSYAYDIDGCAVKGQTANK